MPFDKDPDDWQITHEKIIGLGERSVRKSYYPELRRRLGELERFRYIIDHAGDFIVLFDAATCRITEVNRTLCDRLKVRRKSLVGHPLADVFLGFDCDTVAGGSRGDNPGGGAQKRRFDCAGPDGATVPVETSIKVVPTDEGPLGLLIGRDLTESQRMQEMLLQAQKLEAIGNLAGGIAHDFNNILFPIIGYSEMAIAGLPHDDGNRDHVEKILEAAERAKQLVRQILTFSRPDKEQKRPMKVQAIITEALKLLRPTLPATIEIRQHIDTGCGPVMADPTQIHQVFVNLCTNAYQAMRSDGGVLEISLKEVVVDAVGAAAGRSLLPGRHVCLSVADTGHGMDRDTLNRIFEPYFSTKAKGEGTGLGLSVIHGIVAASGGDIRVESRLNRGTRFSVYLPRIDTAVATAGQPPSPSLPPGGSEHVLLVEDDEMLIQLEEQMLKRLGYRVTAFTDSAAALDYLKNNLSAPDLVLTDMTMPRINGAEVAAQCLALRPDLPVVLCTGYSELIDADKAAAMGIAAFITKPVNIQALAKTLREVLSGGVRGASSER